MGNTPLMITCKLSHNDIRYHEIIKILLKYGIIIFYITLN